MKSEQRLLDALEKRKAVLDERKEAGVAEWLVALHRLFDQITEWLQSFIDAELLRVDRRTVPVTDDDCEPYKAPCLRVSDPAGPWNVDFFPAARYVVGDVTGRVDIPHGVTKHSLLRHGEGVTATWTFRDDRVRSVPSTEEDFVGKPLERDLLFDALAGLLESWEATY